MKIHQWVRKFGFDANATVLTLTCGTSAEVSNVSFGLFIFSYFIRKESVIDILWVFLITQSFHSRVLDMEYYYIDQRGITTGKHPTRFLVE